MKRSFLTLLDTTLVKGLLPGFGLILLLLSTSALGESDFCGEVFFIS